VVVNKLVEALLNMRALQIDRVPPAELHTRKPKGIFGASRKQLEWQDHLNQQATTEALRTANLAFNRNNSILLKRVAIELLRLSGLPIPGLSMVTAVFNPHTGGKERYITDWRHEDWHAICRLREAVAGPWTLPIDTMDLARG